MTMIETESLTLTTDAGRALLAEVARVTRPGPADLARWRRSTSPEWVSAALRLVEGRRKGAAKFTRADRMWFDPVGVEQATAEAVARHKARRFLEVGELVVDLCSGIGGDTLALAGAASIEGDPEAGKSGMFVEDGKSLVDLGILPSKYLTSSIRVIAVDSDPGMGRRALWNAGVYEVADRVLAVACRAEDFGIPAGARVHVDPDRRAGGRARSKGLVGYSPGPDFLRQLASSKSGGAFKLGPASDFETHFDRPEFEIEVISLSGECKEATVWFGDLATWGLQRSATCLPDGATWSVHHAPPGVGPPRAPGTLDAWAYDPDPSLTRSGLLDHFAAVHGLRRIAAGVDLLTGPSLVESPFLAAFDVVEAFPLDLKVLRREVAVRGLGPLEIKTRGLETTPESYRAGLRPEGPNPATLLLIAGHAGPSRAILARRV
jgi:THUMP domain-like